MTQQLLIVRHGETASNVARILQTPDIPLSQRGRQQADRLAQRLTEAPIGLILTSDYQRAMDTTQAIVAATGAPTRVSPLLRERNFGDWRGRPYADFDFDPPLHDCTEKTLFAGTPYETTIPDTCARNAVASRFSRSNSKTVEPSGA